MTLSEADASKPSKLLQKRPLTSNEESNDLRMSRAKRGGCSVHCLLATCIPDEESYPANEKKPFLKKKERLEKWGEKRGTIP